MISNTLVSFFFLEIVLLKIKTKLVQQVRKAKFCDLGKARTLCLHVLLQLYNAMVTPILLYGSDVWGY